jgi:hypothetical protein
MPIMTGIETAVQNAVDRIIWSLYARPRTVPAYVDIVTVSEALKLSGALTAGAVNGHYIAEGDVPEADMRLDDGLLEPCDLGERRWAELAAGEPPNVQEKSLWRRRWAHRALRGRPTQDLPGYRIGQIRARTGESAVWLATLDGGPDAYLGVELFGFACSIEEIFARFRATVVAASPPHDLDARRFPR